MGKVKKLRKDGKDLSRKKGSGGHNKKITDDFLKDLKMKINANPTTSIGNLGKSTSISRRSIGRASSFPGMKSFVRRKRQLLSERTRATRIAKGRKLCSWMEHNRSTIQIFSNEKLWMAELARNSQNDWYLAY